ncbi:transglycosylase SLT domain-containing protein [Legionella yabuuchiae]|uniref:transglycosylase SLT domain-containing protein n=1 Tax=Legionella yabuuchiae TaxID=376727 RepID=UPI001A9537BB|nr:transglycosylase SLT domain-containing protein [Legionella yabuuchiae]
MAHIKRLFILSLIGLLTGCVSAPPSDVNNICRIFKQYPEWYTDAKTVERRWNVSIPVQMAIIHQESKFNARAKPPRTKLLWIIPWTRPSTAYGYTQALESTWEHYKRKRGGRWASRDDFGDGVDFIGWYATMAHERAGISKHDPYSLYLAYHEGIGGYERKTYLKKPWLIGVAHKVSARAQIYQAQLKQCQDSLRKKGWYKFWK